MFLYTKSITLLDKYGSKHTDSRTNVQSKIRGMYEKMRKDGVYRIEVKMEYT